MNTEIFEQFEEFDELKEVKLEKMIYIQFSEEALRNNFELIIKVLKHHRITISNIQKAMEEFQPKEDPSEKEQMKKQVNSNTERIEKLETENEKLKDDISKLNDRIQGVELNAKKEPIQQTIIESSQSSVDPIIIEQLKQNDENQMNEINQLKEQLKEQLKQQEEKRNEEIQKVIIKMNDKEDRMNDKIDELVKNLNELGRIVDDFLEKQRMMEEFRSQQSDEPNSNISNDVIIELKFQIGKQGKQLNQMSDKLGEFVLKPELEEAKWIINEKIAEFLNDQDEKHKLIDQALEDLRNQMKLFVPCIEFEEKIESIQKASQQALDNLKYVYLAEKFTEIQQHIDYFNEEIAGSKSSIIQLFSLFNQINSGMSSLNEKSQDKPIVPVIQAQPQVDHSPKIQALENKIRNLEQQLSKLHLQQNEHEDTYKIFVEKNDNLIQKLAKTKLDRNEYNPQVLVDQIQALRDKINTIYNQYQQTDLQVKQNEEDIANIFSKLSQKNNKMKEVSGQSNQPVGIDEDKLLLLIKKQFDISIKELLSQFQDLQKKLQEKTSKSELDEIAKALRDLMDQIKQLANRAEMKKKFIILEKKINELYQMIIGDEKDKNLDGLLVKRPLGWACASCDKDLTNYQGLLGEYVNWAVFPPKETSPLRMGKYAMHYAEINKQKSLQQQSMTKTTMDAENSSIFSPPSIQTNDQFYAQQQTQPQTVKQGSSMYTLKPVFHPKSQAYKIIRKNQGKLEQEGDMKVLGKKKIEEI